MGTFPDLGRDRLPDNTGHNDRSKEIQQEAMAEALKLRTLGKESLGEWKPKLDAEQAMRKEMLELMDKPLLFHAVSQALLQMRDASCFSVSTVIEGNESDPRLVIDKNYSLHLFDYDSFSVKSGDGKKGSYSWFPQPFSFKL